MPAIDDDGFTLYESIAINLYLARKRGKGLWPATLQGEALAFQWSFFAVTEIEPSVSKWAYHSFVLPEAERDPAVAPARSRSRRSRSRWSTRRSPRVPA